MYYLENICFLCLTHNKTVTPVNKITLKIQEELKYYLPQYLLLKPDAPKNICDDCIHNLKNIYEFKNKCSKNIEIFMEYLEKLTFVHGSYQCLSISVDDLYKNSETFHKNNIEESNSDINVKCKIIKTDNIETPINQIEEENILKVEVFIEHEPYSKNLIEHISIKNEELDAQEDLNYKNLKQEYILGDISTNKIDSDPLITTNDEPTEQNSRTKSDDINNFERHNHTSDKTLLVSTIQTHNTCGGTKIYVCEICQKAFSSNSRLTVHKRTHSGEKPYECEICQRGFNQVGNLKKHKSTVHHGIRPFQCSTCHAFFSEKGALNRHQLTHTDIRPYPCDVCHKSYRDMTTLRNHYRVHTGEKPFVCDVCSKRFTFKTNLIEHERIHSGLKPHVCDVCNKAFGEKKILKRHKRLHDNVEPEIIT